MRSTIEKAPRRSKQEAPMTTAVVNVYSTIGGAAVASRPVIGWEAITPNTHNKPKFLIEAQFEVQEAWSDYLFHTDRDPLDYVALTEAWDRYDTAKRHCEKCYQAFCDGFDYEPIPF